MNQHTRIDFCPDCEPTARLPVSQRRRSRAAAPVFAVASAIMVGLAAVATVTVAWGSVPQEHRSAPPALDPTTEFIPAASVPTPSPTAVHTSTSAKPQPTRETTRWKPPVTTKPTAVHTTPKPTPTTPKPSPPAPSKTPGVPSSVPSSSVSTSPPTVPSSGPPSTPTGTVLIGTANPT